MFIKLLHPAILALAACGILVSACQLVNPVLLPATPIDPGATKLPASAAPPPVQATSSPPTTVPASSTSPAVAATATLIPPTTATATSTTPPVVISATLVPADADAPAAGICAEATGEWAIVQISPDTPSPRCLKVTGEQRLKVINGTQAVVQIKLGEFALELQPGTEGTLEMPFGQYLAPGVHQLLVLPYGGPELWLVEK